MGHRILYLMHVDWRWVRQRPHELAEGLAAAGDEVTVLFSPNFRLRGSPSVAHPGIRLRALPAVPLARLAIVRRLNLLLQRLVVAATARRLSPDVVWITSPELEPIIPRRGHHRLVYDAMDLAAGFHPAGSRGAATAVARERRVCGRAAAILATTDVIAAHLHAESGRQATVVRNAFNDAVFSLATDPPTGNADMFYAGTISHWFDFDLCVRVLERLPHATLTVAGPAELAIPDHPRITHLGVVSHDELAGLAARFGALVMPFRVTPLVEAVDPVKLYEYIAWRRPVIAVRYPELDHFGEMINRYTTADEFVALLEKAAADPGAVLPARRDAERFLAANSWRRRGVQVAEVVAHLDDDGSRHVPVTRSRNSS